ncbi:MAG: MBL fold metallo-hydrolase [Candidatus Binatia bacterium]
MRRYGRQLLVFLIVLLVSGVPAFGQQKPVRKITKIAGDLYRFQNRFHVSVFLVTPDGIIATDPINADAAKWLKAELKKRFNQPVKYLIYSHDHRDHISGGEVFADTAVPDVTFSDRMTIELGGKSVDLVYVGRGHSDNMIVMHFPAERALFAVDFISVKRVGFKNLNDAYFPDWMDGIKLVEGIDFDILVLGHGPMGTKQDARDHRAYLEELYAAVLKGARAGKTLEELQQSIRLEKYKDWGQYKQWLPLNIEGMYRNIQLHRRGN